MTSEIAKAIQTLDPDNVTKASILEILDAVKALKTEHSVVNEVVESCKKTPLNLGQLYLLDAIARTFQTEKDSEYHRAELQKIEAEVAGLLEVWLQNCNEDQRNEVHKIIKIWTASKTFSPETLSGLEEKYFVKPTVDEVMACLERLEANKDLGKKPKKEAHKKETHKKEAAAAPAELAKKEVRKEAPAAPAATALSAAPAVPAAPALPINGTTPDMILSIIQNIQNPIIQNIPNIQNPVIQNMQQPSQQQPRDKKRKRQQQAENAMLYPGERNVPSRNHFRAKPVSVDYSLPPGTVKVLSRTLFVGGIPHDMDKYQLATCLRPYGEIQSVILNNMKRHAFVKVYSRAEAEGILANYRPDPAHSLRLRWGVGFGPRDCCSYQEGVSVIPISRLTEADKRWISEAEWGGIGNQPLQPGLVFEEPDIEIGNGVSSKAISRGPKKSRVEGRIEGPAPYSVQY